MISKMPNKYPLLIIPALLLFVFLMVGSTLVSGQTDPSVSAFTSTSASESAEGCFTYIDSPFFCQEISLQQAQEECTIFDRCSTDRVFAAGKSCSALQSCQKIICKASCAEEFSGRCPSGSVPGDDWCVPGCCQFDYGAEENDYGDEEDGEQYCQYLANKQSCEVEVANRGKTQYFFSGSLTKNTCAQQCASSQPISPPYQISLNLVSSLKPSSLKPSSGVSDKISDKNLTKDPWPGVDAADGVGWTQGIAWILILIIIGVLLYVFRQRIRSLFTTFQQSAIPQNKEFLKILSPFVSNPLARWRIRKLQKKHEGKIKQHRREEFLSAQGLLADKPVRRSSNDPFRRLDRIAKKFEQNIDGKNKEGIKKEIKEPDHKISNDKKSPQYGDDEGDLFDKLKALAEKKL